MLHRRLAPCVCVHVRVCVHTHLFLSSSREQTYSSVSISGSVHLSVHPSILKPRVLANSPTPQNLRFPHLTAAAVVHNTDATFTLREVESEKRLLVSCHILMFGALSVLLTYIFKIFLAFEIMFFNFDLLNLYLQVFCLVYPYTEKPTVGF